ncbi:hypothetical protein Q4566_16640 [Tamlana sp. 2_MG-2023]|uniref:hypothetical protein n=1 Tax=unclassified Tamlana TaxID=2614803 RepID=UPI0026E16213|nr:MULTISPECIES: hypothetical protein [unclassified Tamlana]MDO6761836.1 hypothetical protein [Tamlana sp. 2_MG-2023]MDO6792619.1 hypothetical protein [Tamlana sp. 1_MG-2023]
MQKLKISVLLFVILTSCISRELISVTHDSLEFKSEFKNAITISKLKGVKSKNKKPLFYNIDSTVSLRLDYTSKKYSIEKRRIEYFYKGRKFDYKKSIDFLRKNSGYYWLYEGEGFSKKTDTFPLKLSVGSWFKVTGLMRENEEYYLFFHIKSNTDIEYYSGKINYSPI